MPAEPKREVNVTDSQLDVSYLYGRGVEDHIILEQAGVVVADPAWSRLVWGRIEEQITDHLSRSKGQHWVF